MSPADSASPSDKPLEIRDNDLMRTMTINSEKHDAESAT